jgi:Holliday junction resolvase RusA-like endonuclease
MSVLANLRKTSLIIFGEPASKANSRMLVHFGGKPAFIKSPKALAYESSALRQLKSQLKNHIAYDEPVVVRMYIYYRTQRPDLDESLVLDILQKAEAYKNDRLVREKHIYHGIDKLNPRTEIEIWSNANE